MLFANTGIHNDIHTYMNPDFLLPFPWLSSPGDMHPCEKELSTLRIFGILRNVLRFAQPYADMNATKGNLQCKIILLFLNISMILGILQ